MSLKRGKGSAVWKYFSHYDDENKIAKCRICEKVFSYKTTTTNLKVHLKHHGDGTQEGLERMLNSETEFFHSDDESNESVKEAPETSGLWGCFEQETGGRARCALCRVTMASHEDQMRAHLEERHPKLLNDLDIHEFQKDEDDDQDAFTEVVYLEEPVKSPEKEKLKKQERVRWVPNETPTPIRRLKKRRESISSNDYVLKRKNNDEDEEIEKFGTYITCLLKKLPRDVCMKLQMEIVSLIMTANLNLKNDPNKIIVEKVPMTLVNSTPGTSYYVQTVVADSNKVVNEVPVTNGATVSHSQETCSVNANPTSN